MRVLRSIPLFSVGKLCPARKKTEKDGFCPFASESAEGKWVLRTFAVRMPEKNCGVEGFGRRRMHFPSLRARIRRSAARFLNVRSALPGRFGAERPIPERIFEISENLGRKVGIENLSCNYD